jgi:hypothetical protein
MRHVIVIGSCLIAALVIAAWAYSAPAASFLCKGPVDTGLVHVMSPSDVGVELDTGCTGHIGELRVTDAQVDGVKIKNASANAAHDLVIDKLVVECRTAPAGVHQDGVQVLGGARITIGEATVTGCRTSQVMLKKGGSGKTTPTDVVFGDGFYGPGAAHTFIIGTSVRSGLRDSVACPDTTKRNGAIEVSGATQPVNQSNVSPASC